jgi:hypothetical protein
MHADEALVIPLVPALKAHSWTDFFGIIGIGGIVLAFAQLGACRGNETAPAVAGG